MLSIKNLKSSVDNKKILQGIDLNIAPASIHAIMGPNGSGKSTLAYTLAGHPHYQINSGTISLNKSKLNNLTPDERARKGLFLAFQYPVAIEGISVQNFLKTASNATASKKSKQSVLQFRKKLQQTAKSLGVDTSLLSRSLNDGFSGGEKKRIEVLQMLTLKPKYAIFDETDSGLDIDSIKLAAKGINLAVQKFNTAAIIITHYQRILKHIKPDHVHVMVGGKIAKSGGMELVKNLEKKGYKGFSN